MLTYSFANRGETSLYEYLYQCIRADIESGAIAPGEKLPSKRSFARHLGVSLITVEGAYSQLVAEGYLRAEPRRGYYACDLRTEGIALDHPARRKRNTVPLPAETSDAGELVPEEGLAQAYASLALAGQHDDTSASAGGALSRARGEVEPPSASVADFTGASVPLGLFPLFCLGEVSA